MLEHIVLGIINDTPHTGYEIKKEIDDSIGIMYKASYGSLYPLLKRLLANGFIKETDSHALSSPDSSENGRVKKYYQSTKKGKNYFHAWLMEPMVFPDTIENQLGKVYFFSMLTKKERDEQFASYQKSIAQFKKELTEMHESCLAKPDTAHDYYRGALVYYGQTLIANIERWCEVVKAQKELK